MSHSYGLGKVRWKHFWNPNAQTAMGQLCQQASLSADSARAAVLTQLCTTVPSTSMGVWSSLWKEQAGNTAAAFLKCKESLKKNMIGNAKYEGTCIFSLYQANYYQFSEAEGKAFCPGQRVVAFLSGLRGTVIEKKQRERIFKVCCFCQNLTFELLEKCALKTTVFLL